MSSEDFEGVAGMADFKRQQHEDDRISHAKRKLVGLGCGIAERGDDHSLAVKFPNGTQFHFWPYTGWFNKIGGPKKRANARGLKNLIREGLEK